MSLLDDARRLVGLTPSMAFDECVFCDAYIGCGMADHPSRPHASDCPWLSMPKIVAVIEAAERVAHARDARDVRTLFYETGRLSSELSGGDGFAGVAALKGEEDKA